MPSPSSSSSPSTPLPSHSPPPALSRTKLPHLHHEYDPGKVRVVESLIAEALEDGRANQTTEGSIVASLKGVRLGQSYYPSSSRVPLWRRSLYSPPSTSSSPHLSSIVTREYSLEKWCMEIANDTASLVLSNRSLVAVPHPVATMVHLTVLDLSFNGIVTLPPSLSLLTLLTSLSVSNNRLSTLPPSLGSGLKSLTHLDVSGNMIEGIPDSFGEMVELETFGMDGNRIGELPKGEVLRWRCFWSPSSQLVCYLLVSFFFLSSYSIPPFSLSLSLLHFFFSQASPAGRF